MNIWWIIQNYNIKYTYNNNIFLKFYLCNVWSWLFGSHCVSWMVLPHFLKGVIIDFFKNYRVFRKNCVFFTIHCNPPPRLHRWKRPSKLSTQCECTVTPNGWYFFFTTNSSRGGKLSRILGKNKICNEHPYIGWAYALFSGV